METASVFSKTEGMISQNRKFVFTTVAYVAALVIFLNLSFVNSVIIGALATFVYFLVNGIFLGNAFFREESLVVRFALGNLILFTFLGVFSWLAIIVHNIDTISTAVVLFAVVTLCSASNVVRKKGGGQEQALQASDDSTLSGKRLRLRFLQITFLSFVLLSFYLLFASRRSEVYTVWGSMNPAFIPVFFVTTIMLLLLIVSSDAVSHKLLFVIIQSILVNTFFVFIFPASGDLGGQQTVLGNARLLYDSLSSRGFGVSAESPFIFPHLFMEGFLNAFTVIFARMFAVDIFWTHVLFIPIVWGTFVPLAAFMVTKALGQSDQVSVLASLLFLVFPLAIIWGTITVPMSLGFLTSFWAIYFTLRYVSDGEAKIPLLALAFCLVSFAAHFLTGAISFVFLGFAFAFKRHERGKNQPPMMKRTFFLTSFIFFAILMPLSLPFVRLFTRMYPYFSVGKLNGGSIVSTIALAIFGEYVNFSLESAVVFSLGEIIGFLSMIYLVRKSVTNSEKSTSFVSIRLVLVLFVMLLIDYRILKLFLVNSPFNEERLWLLQDFLVVPFVAIAIHKVFDVLRRKWSEASSHVRVPSLNASYLKKKGISLVGYILLLGLLSSWISASVYYGYPHYSPLQTTYYEIQAAKYINDNTTENYVVIADQWFIYAGEIFYGTYNPHAYYFSNWDPNGVALFQNMKMDPSSSTMIEAMKYNNASVAFFVVEEPRLGNEGFNRVIQQAQENGLLIYAPPFGDGKLFIFYYRI